MSLRSRTATVPVAKVFGPGVPPAIEAAEARSQMTPSSPFSPGEPIGPYDGFSRTPRSHNFTTSVNTSSRPRSHERVSFATLKGLIDSYDVAQLCIRHRIASLRSLDWKLIAAENYNGDVSEAIATGMKALKRPDRKTLFKPWLAKWLRGILSYDAGTLYRMRNRAGRPIGLKVLDGTLIAPMLDYWGDSPDAPAPAYVQYANGLPWDWLTRDDIIYEPYDPQDDSIYGRAPLEDILLNANTDLRFQLYFLQRFTAGNLPAAFAGAPESWTPDQIEQFQEYWDGFMAGDQERKHQIRWIPGGSSFAWSDEKDFTDTFSLFLMRKTCAAYSVVPSDLGFTESVNRSSGESQADVQHRVGDLPLAHHVMDILTAFLQDDLGLPVKFIFDLGEEQDDRLNQAQADEIYIKTAVVGASEVREMRFGLSEPEGQTVPRGFFTERSGLIPLNSVLAVSGPIDPATGAPEPGALLPHEVFGGVEGVLPNPPIKVMSLAEREYGPSAMPPAPPPQPKMTPAEETPEEGQQVAKEGEAAPGITADTGIYSYDLTGRDDDEDENDGYPLAAALTEAHPESIAKELAAFRRYSRARRRAGEWRDFRFDHVASAEARRLNADGRAAVAKDVAPGLTSRSGMISLDLPEGLIEPLPGGVTDHHITMVYLGPDVDDEAFAAACARAQAAAASATGPLEGTLSGIGAFPASGGSDGKVPAWAAVAVPGAEDLREALADLSASEHKHWAPHCTLTYLDPGEPLPAPLDPVPVTFTHLSVHRGDQVVRYPLGPSVLAVKSTMGAASAMSALGPASAGSTVVVDVHGSTVMSDSDMDALVAGIGRRLAKSVATAGGGAGPKAGDGPREWPGWKLDLQAAAYWAPKVTAAAQTALPRSALDTIASGYIADHPDQDGGAPGKRDRNAAALSWLLKRGVTVPLGDQADGITADSVLIGGASAQAAVAGKSDADTQGWTPGDTAAAAAAAGVLGLAALLASFGSGSGDLPDIAGDMEDGYLGVVSRVLAGWDPEVAAGELTDMLETAVADGAYAEALTVTQITTIAGQAALSVYLTQNGMLLQWVTENDDRVCRICLANQAADPRPAGMEWPSGDAQPPAHVRCRCALVPA